MDFGVAFSAEKLEVDGVVGAAVLDFDEVMDLEHDRGLQLLEVIAVPEAVPAEVAAGDGEEVDEIAVRLAARLAIVRRLRDPAEAMVRAADRAVMLCVGPWREDARPAADRAGDGVHRSPLLGLGLHGAGDEDPGEGGARAIGGGSLSIKPCDVFRRKIKGDEVPLGVGWRLARGHRQ
jgi:hypothetical protein